MECGRQVIEGCPYKEKMILFERDAVVDCSVLSAKPDCAFVLASNFNVLPLWLSPTLHYML